MKYEKRRHPRFNPKGLIANITIIPPSPSEKISIEGTIVDMSYKGIKIKLYGPIQDEISDSEIRISFPLPGSGIPVAIHGKIKHLNNNLELGLLYSELHSEQKIDDLMFECIKLSDQHTQCEIIPFPVRK